MERWLVVEAVLCGWVLFAQVGLGPEHVHLSFRSMHQLELQLLAVPLIRIDIQAEVIPCRIDELLRVLLLRLR